MSQEMLIPAARYLRMSTERQQYSFINQSELIARYAESHGFCVVKTYSDAARTGVTFRRRLGLQTLIQDVVQGHAAYKAILVYDVSRWGRFQDTDESAHYEFLCKSAGIPVHYCAEPFSNDRDLASSIMKSLKRVMAGEYSRELGVRIFAAQKRFAALGYKQGGQPGYGLRRLLISPDGKPKQLLATGERKSIANDRVVQVPGPADEVACVRDIYKLFLGQKMSFSAIATELNRRGIHYLDKSAWGQRAVREVLTKPKYAGINVYGRSSMRLSTPKLDIPRSEWTVCPRAFEPVVEPSMYEQVQRVIAGYTRKKTNDQLIDDLKSVIAKEGRLNKDLVDSAQGIASSTTYRTRFGSIGRAFAEVGYQCHATEDWLQKFRKVRSLRAKLMEDIVLASAGRVCVDDREDGRFRTCLLLKDTGRLVAVVISRHHMEYKVHHRWRIRSLPNERRLITLVARLDETNDGLLDLFVIAPLDKSNYVRVRKDDARLTSFACLADLGQFAAAVEAIFARKQSVNWAWSEPSDALASKQQLRRIARVPKCALMRRGINQQLLYRICRGKPVRASKLALCLKALKDCEVARAGVGNASGPQKAAG